MKIQKYVIAVLCAAILALVGIGGASKSLADFQNRDQADFRQAEELTLLTWNVATDFRLSPYQANPNPDKYGNAEVWHYLRTTDTHDPSTYSLITQFYPNAGENFGLQGWEGPQPTGYPNSGAPDFNMNASGLPMVFDPNWILPPGVFMTHPDSSQPAVLGWESPYAGSIAIDGGVTDVCNMYGDGIVWYIDKNSVTLASGSYPNAGTQLFKDGTNGGQLGNISVSKGDFIYFLVAPGGDYYCDGTQLDVTITMSIHLPTGLRTWDLDSDFRVTPNQANPNPDSYGNAEVWYFMRTTAAHNPSTYALNTVFYPNVGDHPGFQGWEGPEATGYPNSGVPEFALNTSGAPVIQANDLNYPPGEFEVHPASSQPAILGWRSPLAGSIAIEGGVKDVCTGMGEGILWYIDKGVTTLASGSYPNGGSQLFKNGTNGNQLGSIPVNEGDFIYILIAPGSEYYCDGTQLDLTITMNVTPPTRTPTPTYTPDGDWIFCAKENGTCTLPGTRLVRYGANGRYLFKNLSGSFVCSTAFSSDPIPGVAKSCHYNQNAGAPLPTGTFTPTYTPTQTSTPTQTPTLTATPTAIVQACTKKPKELEPADGAAVSGPEVILKWREAGCADRYDIQIVRVSDDQMVANKSGHTKARYTFKDGVAGETYAWQVRACNAVGCGPWTTPRRFTIQP